MDLHIGTMNTQDEWLSLEDRCAMKSYLEKVASSCVLKEFVQWPVYESFDTWLPLIPGAWRVQ